LALLVVWKDLPAEEEEEVAAVAAGVGEEEEGVAEGRMTQLRLGKEWEAGQLLLLSLPQLRWEEER